MKVKFKKYIARYAVIDRNENGELSVEEKEMEITNERKYERSIKKALPKGATLLEHGWDERTFEVNEEKLLAFLIENGEEIDE